jgi:hypothetical protein
MSFWNGREGAGDAPSAIDVKRESRVRHVAKALLEAGLITALTFGLIAGSTFAARGGGSGGGGGHGKPGGGGGTTGGGTITLASPLVVDRNGNGTPNWGDVVRFNISTSNSQPWVFLTCSQGGSVVAQGSEGYFAGALDDGNFGLYSPMWSGGAADCVAKLQTYSGSVLGSLSFHVDA